MVRPGSALRHLRQAAFAAALVLCVGSPAHAQDVAVAELQGLDKVTARVTPIEAPVGVPVRFGTLEILVLACSRTPPEEPPESAVFLDVRELRNNEPPAQIFSGWMFASSPGLSALEHPVYDIWVTGCRPAASADETAGKPKD